MVISKLESPGHRMTLMQNLVEESGMLDEEELAVLVEHGIEPDWVQGIPHPKMLKALGLRAVFWEWMHQRAQQGEVAL